MKGKRLKSEQKWQLEENTEISEKTEQKKMSKDQK